MVWLIDFDRFKSYSIFLKRAEYYIADYKYKEWLKVSNDFFNSTNKSNTELNSFYKEVLLFFRILKNNSNLRVIYNHYMDLEINSEDLLYLFEFSMYAFGGEIFNHYVMFENNNGSADEIIKHILYYGAIRGLDIDYFVYEFSKLGLDYITELKPVLDRLEYSSPSLINGIKKAFIKDNINYLKLIHKT